MLNIVDINTNSQNLEEVNRLKQEFEEILSPTVNDGSLVIVSNFPATANIQGRLDYLIFFWCKPVSRNYLRGTFEGTSHYIDSFIYVIRKIEDNGILQADGQYLYNEQGMFDYSESQRNLFNEIENYISSIEKVKCYGCYDIKTIKEIQIHTPYININKEISSREIIDSVTAQSVHRNGNYRINSFTKDRIKELDHDSLNILIRELIAAANEETKFGILTKTKIDKITQSPKTIDEIYDNVGKSISIIKGKAGTGKTLTLTRLIHKHVSGRHHIRFLSFNHLLLFDIKQNLRNFDYYGDNRIYIRTVQSYFSRLANKLGVSLILGEERVASLIATCDLRVNKMRNAFASFKGSDVIISKRLFLQAMDKSQSSVLDNEEFLEFASFVENAKDQQDFDVIKNNYLLAKKQLLQAKVGKEIFLEDYYKVLELIYEAVTDKKEFYEKWNIKNRYELLSTVYQAHKFTNEKEITFENFEEQVSSIARLTKWSTLLIIDEAQDFHVWEKEILFHLRGAENFIVASGGPEQLIRHSTVLDWSVSWTKPIPSKQFSLSGGSYRQKQNIISFVNKFALEYGMKIDLKPVGESKGLGTIIIDTRPKNSLINDDIAIQLSDNATINKCSPYEGLMILIPSKEYTKRKMVDSFVVNDKDYVKRVETSIDRHTENLDKLKEVNLKGWDGVSENKGQLRLPNQNEIRIIHYESCRGLESWCTACMSIDLYFKNKRASDNALSHRADDLFLDDETRRDYYAAMWCLMAFTRPMDTLYIHIKDSTSNFSQKLINLAKTCEGVIFKE